MTKLLMKIHLKFKIYRMFQNKKLMIMIIITTTIIYNYNNKILRLNRRGIRMIMNRRNKMKKMKRKKKNLQKRRMRNQLFLGIIRQFQS